MLEIFTFINKVKAQTLPNITDINLPTSHFEKTGLVGVVSGVIDWILLVAGGLAVIAIVYSGIMYITSGGDTTKAETAKKNLIWAISGIVVITLAYVIIQWTQVILSGKL